MGSLFPNVMPPRTIDSRTGLSDHAALAVLRLLGFKSRAVPTSTGRVHVLEARGGASGPPVVLLHGFAANCGHFFGLLRRLKPHLSRLIVPDAPAHGFSDVPSRVAPETVEAGLFEALDALLDEPALVYGNSMGGLAALRYTLSRPEKVRGLVICSPVGAPMNEAELDRFLAGFDLPDHASALTFVDRVFSIDGPARHLLAWGVRRRFGHPDMQALLAEMKAGYLLRPDDLRRLAPPTLFVWGREERVLPEAHRDFFLAHLPQTARVEEPPRFGHGPYLQHPEAVARQILAFLRSLPEQGPDLPARVA